MTCEEMHNMDVLIACEESQRVCTAFRERGRRAFSCDIKPCSGGHPEWHIRGDCLPLLNGNCTFVTSDGEKHTQNGRWDMIIAHPPCTYLSSAGNGYFSVERYGEKAIERRKQRERATEFFMKFTTADCDRIAIENPVGYMNTHYRKPDQTIHPYFFATNATDSKNYHLKRTCLWLKGLTKLQKTSTLPKPQPIRIGANGKKRYFTDTLSGSASKKRSKTFPGIARAMAEQWG